MGSCSSLPIDEDLHKVDVQEKPTMDTNEHKLSCYGNISDPLLPWIPANNCHKHIRRLLIKPERLAHGNTSSVLSAKYKGRLCAFKQIERNNEESRMVFTTEAKSLSKLNHKCIIKYIDILMDEQYYYLLTEKADYTLHNLIEKKYLSEQFTKQVIYQILGAIYYIHKKNLVHRDIKPENIVFMKNNPNVPKIIDFGDAEMARPNKIYTEFVGTPIYMSPERLRECYNSEALKKSDIWAIGALTFEMFCGETCFKGNTETEVFKNISEGNWSWNIERIPMASAEMQDFVKHCLDRDIETRFYADDALKHQWFEDIEV